VEEDQNERDFTNDDRNRYLENKVAFTTHITNSVKSALQVQQTWLVFNASIEFWNNYLPVFKKGNFYALVLKEGVQAMVECFEAMNSCFIHATFTPGDNVDYDLTKKMQVFSNASMILARIYEFLGKSDSAVRVCNILLEKQLPSHLKKSFDAIKARVTK